jgi:hypothetical protein
MDMGGLTRAAARTEEVGLGAQEVNKNQGAESVVSFLLALLAMLGLADDGLRTAERVHNATE